MGGTIGFATTDTWKPYTNSDRENHANMVQNFERTLKKDLLEKTRHNKKLAFMADNGIRQLGPPRIGVFADKQRPEPLHCEINAWQQVLNIIYQESVQRKVFDQFIKVLAAAPIAASAPEAIIEEHETQVLGCGLLFLVPFLKEHFNDEKRRFNKIPTRLIGEQAIAIARYGYRLVDCVEFPAESAVQRVKRLSLSRIVLYLRNACATFNKVSSTKAELLELEENCKLYFNLLCLFFPSHVNITSWTVGYAVPYHALKLYDMYKIGYGIISQQGKEAKHSAVKNDLELSNRSNKFILISVAPEGWQTGVGGKITNRPAPSLIDPAPLPILIINPLYVSRLISQSHRPPHPPIAPPLPAPLVCEKHHIYLFLFISIVIFI